MFFLREIRWKFALSQLTAYFPALGLTPFSLFLFSLLEESRI
jgi:hypothetical protein